MKKKLKSSLKIVSIALILVLVVSMICMSGSAADLFGRGSHQSWSNLPAALPFGTVNYYAVSCRNAIDSGLKTVFLKVEKVISLSNPSEDSLNVYESDSLENPDFTELSTDFEAISTYTVASGTEGWTIVLKEDIAGEYTNKYSNIVSVSPLTATITSTQTWDGMSDSGYIDVAPETTVKYVLKDPGSNNDITEFYIKKAESSLKVSLSPDGYDFTSDNAVLSKGQTINAFLIPSSNFGPERWIITITGYDRHDADGKLIDYLVEKKDINSSQAWMHKSTQFKQTFSGVASQTGTYVYTLNLKESSLGTETAILEIKKTVFDNTVTEIAVEGVTAGMGPSPVFYSTVKNAECGYYVQTADDGSNRITINNMSNIKVSDIMSSENGLKVNFNIGSNNGDASVTLKLTESGRLSYSFAGLPADSFTPDMGSGQDATSIAVDSYNVTVSKVS